MNRVDQLMLRLEIEELNAEFAYLVDRGDSSQVAELFVEEGSYGRATGERSVGRDAIRAAYIARAAHGERTARHIFTNLRLAELSAARVAGTCVLTLFAQDGPPPLVAEPFLVADYDDIYRKDNDGRWRYESRTITWKFLQRDGKVSPLPLGGKP